MNQRSLWLAGTAFGAGLMYLLDPVSGRRRRAFTRDKMTHSAKQADRWIGQTSRDLRNRYEGALAELRRLRVEEEIPGNDVLADRVRTALGRVISHPRSLEVSADNGWVKLSGPILVSEEKRLLNRVRRIAGVRGIENELNVYKKPAHISGLQGGMPRQERFELFQTNWSPAIRLLSTITGGAAALYGFRQGRVPGVSLGLLGIAFAARGLSNKEIRKLMRVTPREPAEVVIQKTVLVEAAPEKIANLFADLKNLPQLLPGIDEIKDIGEGRSEWRMTLDDKSVHWEAITVSSKNAFTWKTQPGAALANSGVIRIEPAGEGTRVQITLTYRPSRGLPSRIVEKWFGRDPARYLAESLGGLKAA
jgi:uncharacterized membrane protein